MSKKLVAMLTLGALLGGALIAVPTVSAQVPPPNLATPSVKGDWSGPIDPLVTQGFTVTSTLTFTTQLQPLGGAAEGAVPVSIDVQCPAGVTVTGQESIVIDTAAGGGQEQAFPINAEFQLTISRTIPAREPQQCSVEISADTTAQSIPSPSPQSTTFSVQAEYFGLIEAKTDVKLKQGGPQKQIPFNIEVTNFGNGQTKVTFATLESPSGKWQGLVPDQLLLDEVGGERQSATSIYTVVTPFKNGWNNEEGGFTLSISPEYAFDPDQEGSEIVVNLVARVRGVYVPSLEPMIMLGAVIGTALMARMLREDE